MYPYLFRGLGLKIEDLSKYNTLLVGFDGQMVVLDGQILLPMNMEGKEVMVNFIFVSSFSPYTTILYRPWIHAMEAMPFAMHVKVKFRTDHDITIVRGNQQVARQCLVVAINREIKQKDPAEDASSQKLHEPHGEQGMDSAEDLIKVCILPDENKKFQIGTSIKHKERVKVLLFPVQNLDIFAQSPFEVPAVDPEFII